MARWLISHDLHLTFERAFCVQAPLEQVRRFHTRPEAFQALSPPGVKAEIRRAELAPPGGDFEFTLRIGPLPVDWLARIEWTDPNSFSDYQVSGPFRFWLHEHRFHQGAGGRTLVIDRVTLKPRLHPLWTPFGIFMAAGLPALFWYRARVTRRILSRRDSETCQPRSALAGSSFQVNGDSHAT